MKTNKLFILVLACLFLPFSLYAADMRQIVCKSNTALIGSDRHYSFVAHKKIAIPDTSWSAISYTWDGFTGTQTEEFFNNMSFEENRRKILLFAEDRVFRIRKKRSRRGGEIWRMSVAETKEGLKSASEFRRCKVFNPSLREL